MNPQDMTREDWRQYLRDNGPYLELTFNKLCLALESAGYDLKALEAHERASYKPADFAEQVMDAALAFLPEELREFLQTTTGPLLAFDGVAVRLPAQSAHSRPSAVSAEAK